jgi:hypothetical protein
MAGPTLVIAHPPHGDVDVQLAAFVLGLTPVDVRLKVAYPIPEIWFASDDRAAADHEATLLRRAGIRVVVVPGAALAAVPARRVIGVFAFGEGALVLHDGDEYTLPYDSPVVAVLFTPRIAETKGPQPPSFLDLYLPPPGEPRRWTVLQGATGFDGMGDRQTASFGTNVHQLAARIEERFVSAVLDRRLEHMRVRRRLGVPPPGVARQGYSFATAALNALLEAVRPGLSEIENDDLSSRLAYLTHLGT